MPIRVILIFLLFLLMFLISLVMTVGVKDSEITRRPFTGWRKKARGVVRFIGRAVAFCCGFHKIKKNGRRATREEVNITNHNLFTV